MREKASGEVNVPSAGGLNVFQGCQGGQKCQSVSQQKVASCVVVAV